MTAREQARYIAKTMGDVVQLRDAKTDTVVSVLTGVSNAYEMVVKGENVIRVPFQSVDDMRARPGLNGIPLLAPFANRLDEQAFYANGRKYNFDMELGNVRGAIPMHGYLSGTNLWKLVEAKADASGAWVTNRLDFYRNPRYMKQFPFAHTLTMTYRLSDGALEVRTRDRQPRYRADARRDRVPSVLPVDRFAPKRLDVVSGCEDPLAPGADQDPHGRDGDHREVLRRRSRTRCR